MDDFVHIFKTLINIYHDLDEVDDINLSNRVRTVGELLQERYKSFPWWRASSRNACHPIPTRSPCTLNSNALISVVQSLFLTGQLTNSWNRPILAALRHKRPLGLGPGGLTRDRAGFEVRTCTPPYGRVCPIETPEGPNIV